MSVISTHSQRSGENIFWHRSKKSRYNLSDKLTPSMIALSALRMCNLTAKPATKYCQLGALALNTFRGPTRVYFPCFHIINKDDTWVVLDVRAPPISEWVLSKFNGTSTPKGSYRANRVKQVIMITMSIQVASVYHLADRKHSKVGVAVLTPQEIELGPPALNANGVWTKKFKERIVSVPMVIFIIYIHISLKLVIS